MFIRASYQKIDEKWELVIPDYREDKEFIAGIEKLAKKHGAELEINGYQLNRNGFLGEELQIRASGGSLKYYFTNSKCDNFEI